MYSPPTTTGTMTYSTAAGSGGGTHTSGSRKTITTTQPHGGKHQHGGKGECFDTAYGCCHYWFAITSGGTSTAHSTAQRTTITPGPHLEPLLQRPQLLLAVFIAILRMIVSFQLNSPFYSTNLPSIFFPLLACPICLEAFKNPTKTSCGHAFCSGCLNKALQYDPYCPTCKKPLRTIVGKQPKGGRMSHRVCAWNCTQIMKIHRNPYQKKFFFFADTLPDTFWISWLQHNRDPLYHS